MEQKKTNRADLEGKRGIFFKIGLIVAISLMIVAFEWSTVVDRAEDYGLSFDPGTEDLIEIPITRQEPELLPPTPPARHVVEIIEICSDPESDCDDFFFNAEADENTEVKIVEMVEPEPAVYSEPVDEIDPIIDFVEQAAEFPGGETALRMYIAKNLHYPELAKDNDIQGTVYVRFVVEKDGRVGDIEILRGVDPLLDKEATRVISGLPKFTPAQQMGRKVRTRIQIPVKFKLQ